MPRELAGRWYDDQFLADLPDGADPCGEHGEFHTVVVDGPGFASPIDVRLGVQVERDGFLFVDVVEETLSSAGRIRETE
jgi:diphthamide synthase (EF-2-diphthine--ammonia ligase)